MTREEAIKTIENAKHFAYDDVYTKAFDMAIKALEQEPCEDAVSRTEVLNLVRFNAFHVKSQIKAIENMPLVTPQKPILDKIREEIGKAWHTKPKNRYEEGLKDQALKDMQIIDKYKIESEDKNDECK